jgi:hypothetical protein
MIAHVVLLTPRADLSVSERASFVAAFERAAREIPTIRAVRIGRRAKHGAAYERSAPDADYIAILEFDDLDGLRTYLNHPAHAELGGWFARALSAAMAYDFDVGGIDRLRAGGFVQSE